MGGASLNLPTFVLKILGIAFICFFRQIHQCGRIGWGGGAWKRKGTKNSLLGLSLYLGNAKILRESVTATLPSLDPVWKVQVSSEYIRIMDPPHKLTWIEILSVFWERCLFNWPINQNQSNFCHKCIVFLFSGEKEKENRQKKSNVRKRTKNKRD